MAQCRDCIFFESRHKEIDSDLYPVYTNNFCTNFHRAVSPNAKCDDYIEKSTPQNSHYTGGGGEGGGCFLTSACVEYLGKEDNCTELTLLRRFRDEYMNKSKEGAALVKEYYEIAPTIVKHINSSTKKKDYYNYIYSVISECVNLLKKQNNEAVLTIYKKMVLSLKNEFGI